MDTVDIDKFRIKYKKIQLGVYDNELNIPTSFKDAHYIIYYKIFNIYIKIFEFIELHVDPISDFNVNKLYNFLGFYFLNINKGSSIIYGQKIIIIRSKVYFYVNKIKKIYYNIINKFYKKDNIEFGYE